MGLRSFIRDQPETASDMLLAADDRYREAEELLLLGEFDGATYCFGYAAEMWLKVACVRLRGHGPTTQVKAALPPIKSWMKLTAPAIAFTDYHDLSFLANTLAALRVAIGRPVPPALLAELQVRIAQRLNESWIVDMRYRRSGLTAREAWVTLVDTWWIKSNWIRLL